MVGKVTRLQQARAAEPSAGADAASTPGKRALTDDLAILAMAPAAGQIDRASPPSAVQAKSPRSALPRLDLVPGQKPAAGSTRAAPPRRVADATTDEPNAVIKVVAYSKGKILGTPWGAKGRWEGPLPQKYTGTRSATGWTWDNPDAKTVRLGSDLHGRGGRTAEAWAGANADRSRGTITRI